MKFAAALLAAATALAPAVPAAAQMRALSDPVIPHPDPESLFTSTDPVLNRNKQAAPEIATYPITTAHEILTQIPAISGDYDVLVADAPAALGAEIASLVTVSDLCLMPIGASMLDVWASYRTARIIYRVRFRGRPRREVAAYCVLNRVVPKAPVTQVAAAAIHHFGFPVALSTVRFREAYLEAASRRTTVQKLGRAGRHASRELDALFNEVLALDGVPAAGVSSGAAVLEAGQAGAASC